MNTDHQKEYITFLEARLDHSVKMHEQAMGMIKKLVNKLGATTPEEAISMFPEVAYWHSEFQKYNTTK